MHGRSAWVTLLILLVVTAVFDALLDFSPPSVVGRLVLYISAAYGAVKTWDATRRGIPSHRRLWSILQGVGSLLLALSLVRLHRFDILLLAFIGVNLMLVGALMEWPDIYKRWTKSFTDQR